MHKRTYLPQDEGADKINRGGWNKRARQHMRGTRCDRRKCAADNESGRSRLTRRVSLRTARERSACRLWRGRVDVIHLAIELHGDRLGLAQVLVIFGLLRAGELEVGVGQLRHHGRLGVFIGRDGRVDPALVFPVERLGADLADLALE